MFELNVCMRHVLVYYGINIQPGIGDVTRAFALDLLETALTSSPALFLKHTDFAFLLKDRVCSLIIKMFNPNIKVCAFLLFRIRYSLHTITFVFTNIDGREFISGEGVYSFISHHNSSYTNYSSLASNVLGYFGCRMRDIFEFSHPLFGP